jgi:hypothetical protein
VGVRRRTSTLVASAGLILLACGLFALAWEFLFTWALSGGTYPGPVYAVSLPLTVAGIVCVLTGRRLGRDRPRSVHHHATP